MGIYKDKQRVGYEVFYGVEAMFFPPSRDLLALQKNVLLVSDKRDGYLLFLKINLDTLLRKGEKLKYLLREYESVPFMLVLEVHLSDLRRAENLPDVVDLLELLRTDFSVSLSLSGFELSVEDYNLTKHLSPDYIKLSVRELTCLPKESAELIVKLLEENTSSRVVFTHVESREDFEILPERALWLGYYEESLRSS